MYIKQVIINGFKSYKDNTIVEPFSRNSNVVVGKNGTGKSNFFYAVRFVLSDELSTLSKVERQGLLHEGTGVAVLSAYVELVCDNSDNRFPIEKDEVLLRRSIGQKKDEYFVDGKHHTKSEFFNLLETAGLSRSNPYFIVQQGKVTQLTVMKDKERLQLLKEVAGTNVYEERRDLSLDLLKDTLGKQEKVEEVLGYIEERLSQLDEEKEELKEYQQHDRNRRALEYTIHEHQLTETNNKLQTVESHREGEQTRSNEAHARAAAVHHALANKERESRLKQTEVQRFEASKANLDEERSELVKKKTRVELDVSELSAKKKANATRKAGLQKKLSDIRSKIASAKDELEKEVQPTLKKAIHDENEAKKLLEAARAQADALYGRKGRSKQFKSKAERDRFLKTEIRSAGEDLLRNRAQTKKFNADINNYEAKLDKLKTALSSHEVTVKQKKQEADALRVQASDLALKRDTIYNQRQDLWREQGDVDSQYQQSKTELHKARRNLRDTMPKILGRGIEKAMEIAELKQMQGVYGPLIDLMDVHETFYTAVENTANNSLFHIVVDTDATAQELLLHLAKENSGKVTCIPLNRMQPKTVTITGNQDVLPLLEKINFQEEHRLAFAHVFGRTYVARNMEVAAIVAKEHQVNCVTLEGDQVERKGVITGGFRENEVSRLTCQKAIRDVGEQLSKLSSKMDKSKSAVSSIDHDITQLVNEIEVLERQRAEIDDAIRTLSGESKNMTKQQTTTAEALRNKQKALHTLETSIAQTEEQEKMLKEELAADMTTGLSGDAEDQLQAATAEVDRLNSEVAKLAAEKETSDTRRKVLETMVNNNLVKKEADYVAQVEATGGSTLEEDLASKQAKLQAVSERLTKVTDRTNNASADLDEATNQLSEIKRSVDQLKNEERSLKRSGEEERREIEKVLGKRAHLLKRRDECMRHLKELGSISEEAVARFKNLSSKQLNQELAQCKDDLAKFGHVNQKALDQYISFTDQRESLTKRKKELEVSSKSIDDLVKVLDQRKDEAIERTYKGVAKNFAEVFKEMIPKGKASMHMVRAKNDEGGLEYSGVSIKVSFTGTSSHNISQLSGGQKTMVAMALLFAIQRCDPSPFYLFDEIDANLDADHRRAVAALIERQANAADSTQFICTTFWPEMVATADKVYATAYSNKVSSIHVVDKDEAEQALGTGERV